MTFLLFWLGGAIVVGVAASSRTDRNGGAWMLLSLLISPLLAGLLLLAVGPARRAPLPQPVYMDMRKLAPSPAPGTTLVHQYEGLGAGFWIVIITIVAVTVFATIANSDPLPVPRPSVGGSCPFGYSTSGSFCVPRQGAHDAVEKPSGPGGSCPWGWTASGSYCLRSGS